MSNTSVRVPHVQFREVEVEVPDSVASLFTSDSMKARGERAARVASTVRQQAAPKLAKAAGSASVTAGKLGVRGAELAVNARELGSTLAERSREEWGPSARAKWDETAPSVGEAMGKGVARAGATAAVASAGATAGAKAAAAAGRQAASSAASATGSAISQVFRLGFWVGVAAWLLIRIFRPQREQREQLYARIRRWTGFES
ncbi:MAG: hypothetical protein M3281_02980 [Chloroflexota bacterium]|nr:hypothetical protein [Chloroflexota bacterium]